MIQSSFGFFLNANCNFSFMIIGIAATTGAADVDAEHSGSGSSMIIFSADNFDNFNYNFTNCGLVGFVKNTVIFFGVVQKI
jgi:hypothetical protein